MINLGSAIISFTCRLLWDQLASVTFKSDPVENEPRGLFLTLKVDPDQNLTLNFGKNGRWKGIKVKFWSMMGSFFNDHLNVT